MAGVREGASFPALWVQRLCKWMGAGPPGHLNSLSSGILFTLTPMVYVLPSFLLFFFFFFPVNCYSQSFGKVCPLFPFGSGRMSFRVAEPHGTNSSRLVKLMPLEQDQIVPGWNGPLSDGTKCHWTPCLNLIFLNVSRPLQKSWDQPWETGNLNISLKKVMSTELQRGALRQKSKERGGYGRMGSVDSLVTFARDPDHLLCL